MAVTHEEQMYWLALRMVPGLGPRRAVPLVQQFGSVEAVFRATTSELIAAGLPGGVAQTISSGCTFEEAAEQQRLIAKLGVSLVPFQDSRYPRLLKEIHDPPLVLYARGRVELLQQFSLGVVGTRRPTPYGLAATERIATELARTGLVITSGMARGIDSAAHKATLATGGDTMAVFGSGIDHIYPAENKKLSEEISAKGLLLSEYPMGTPGHPQNFPVRNRIISGLSVGVLVVEGAQYSGSAITAMMAMEQGREVFAVPGNITSKMSWGPNLLIKQGAKLVQSAEDVLAELSAEVRQQIHIREESLEPNGASDGEKLRLALGPKAPLGATILGLLRVEEGTHLDQMIDQIETWEASEVMAVLFELQLQGVVRELPGRNFVRVWGESGVARGASVH